MFRIETAGPGGAPRLVATAQLTGRDFDDIATRLGSPPFRARKVGLVAARQATAEAKIETRWNRTETTNTAAPGDWIVTNMTPDAVALRDNDGNKNVYVIPADRFPTLYEPAGQSSSDGDVYAVRATVRVLELPGGFEIVAPWGEVQTAAAGYLIDNGAEVYGNAQETFLTTYRRV